MKSKFKVLFVCLCLVSATVLPISGITSASQSEVIDVFNVFSKVQHANKHEEIFTPEGLYLKGKSGSDGTVYNTYAGEQLLNTPLSLTFRHDTLPVGAPESGYDAAYDKVARFTLEGDNEKNIYIESRIITNNNVKSMIVNIVSKEGESLKVFYDWMAIPFEIDNYSTTFFSFTYDYQNKQVVFGLEGQAGQTFDLTKYKNGDSVESEVLALLPDNQVGLNILTTRGSVIIKEINGQSCAVAPAERIVDNLKYNDKKDIFSAPAPPPTRGTLTYEEKGIKLGLEKPNGTGEFFLNPSYTPSDGVIDFQFSSIVTPTAAKSIWVTFRENNSQPNRMSVQFNIDALGNMVLDRIYHDVGTNKRVQYFGTGNSANPTAMDLNYNTNNTDNPSIRVIYDSINKYIDVVIGDVFTRFDLTKLSEYQDNLPKTILTVSTLFGTPFYVERINDEVFADYLVPYDIVEAEYIPDEKKIYLDVSSLSTDDLYQVWVKRDIWLIQQQYTNNNRIAMDFGDKDEIEVLVRIKHNNQIKDIYKILNKSNYMPILDTVRFNEKNHLKTDIIYMPKSGGTLIPVFKGVTPSNVVVTGGEYDSSTSAITFDAFSETGTKIIELSADGITEKLKIYVYEDSLDFSYITDVTEELIDEENYNVQLTANIANRGNSVENDVIYSMNGTKNSTGKFMLNDIGYYSYSVTLLKNGVKEDSFDKYYFAFFPNSSKSNADLSTLNKNPDSDDGKYIIGITDAQEGYQYQIILWDAASGENENGHIIKNYNNAKSFIDFKPTMPGIYRFEYRVRAEGSKAAFEKREYIYVNYGDITDNTQVELSIDSEINARIPVTISASYNGDQSDSVLYKFIVSTKGYWKIEQTYSPYNDFVFIPNKPGEYIIQVLVIINGHYSYSDITYTAQTITVL